MTLTLIMKMMIIFNNLKRNNNPNNPKLLTQTNEKNKTPNLAKPMLAVVFCLTQGLALNLFFL
jgi:hypothetical protein